ncbi:hypothetical protein [Virgibacillus pantothenticus]|nr:hypothetical protein [Virgibacillus pantothenticus]
MVTFLQLCKNTESRLGRQLLDNEILFLQWVYNRYLKEKPKKMLNA